MARRKRPRQSTQPSSPVTPARGKPAAWMSGAAVLSILALVSGVVWWRTRASAFVLPRDPDQNVLLVTIDTLRADALSSYGGPAATPNLDALAAHGARFTFAHAHTVLTLPSHTTIFTGRYPYDHGVRDNNGYRVRAGDGTVATRLKARGFATAAFVGAFTLERRFGLNAGFDVYEDRVGEVGSSANFDQTERRADEVVKLALDWIEQRPAKWFAWVHVFDPHAPYKPPDAWAARYPGQPYYGEVAWTDAALGSLFDRLATLPRPTLVIVTADHGEALGDHGELTHGVFAYEATLRVPLIVTRVEPQNPGHRKSAPAGGVVIDAPVRHIDLLPTMLDSIGAPPDAALPGSSLRDLIARRTGPDRPAYFEAMMTNLARGWAPLRGVLMGREKYIDLPIPELYDLAGDPGESRNLASDHQDRSATLLGLLRSYNTARPNRPVEETSGVKERLRSLGYIATSPAPGQERYTERDDPKRLIDLDRRMHTAVDAYQGGKLTEAVGILQQVINERPDTAEAYLDLAVAYWQAGQQHEAIRTLEDAMHRGVSQQDVRVKLGLCLALSGDGRRAIPLLEGSARDDPDALNALGLAYAQAGRPADAVSTFRRILEIDPASGLAYENIASVSISAKDFGSAEVMLRRALDLDPKLTGARTALGTVQEAVGKHSEAIESWKRTVELDAEAYDALYDLTFALAEGGHRDEAQAYGQRFIQTAPPTVYASQINATRRLLGR